MNIYVFGILSLLFCLPILGFTANCTVFYVSSEGSDRWSGKLPAPNAKRTDGPFATLEKARDSIRELKVKSGGLKAPVTVYLRRGTYHLPKAFELTTKDSGTKEYPITYSSYPGEKAVLSGGTELKGFTEEKIRGKTVWTAVIPEVRNGKWHFKQLWVNGERRFRPRLPSTGLYRFTEIPDLKPEDNVFVNQDRARFREGDIKKDWKNLNDIEIVALTLWAESRMPIEYVDDEENIVKFTKKSVLRLLETWGEWPAPYYVENVFEALDEPGEWYLDRSEGKLYYIPKPGETLKNVKIVAPRLTQVVKVEGEAEKETPVKHIRFQRLGISHTEWEREDGKSGDHQAAINVPGALLLNIAHNCEVSNCEVVNVGGYGIEIGAGSRFNEIRRNIIRDLGGGGVKVASKSWNTVVADNEIGPGGHIYHSAVGIYVGKSGRNKVLHNHIHHFYYTGISVGWTWGYYENSSFGNDIGWNYIHNIGQGLLSDMGGIYHLGIAPGTKIHHNLIHDVESATYGGWGIYLDEGSSDVLVFDNITYNTKNGGFHLHYGKNNTIRNNIFAFSREWQIQYTKVEKHKQFTFTFERNIVIWSDGTLFFSHWKKDQKSIFFFDRNLYYNTKGNPVTFAGLTFEEWQSVGQDINSIIADPKFMNAEAHDFRLKKDSPAFKLGFRPIDLSKAGPRYATGM